MALEAVPSTIPGPFVATASTDKQARSLWPWIVGALVLALLIWLLYDTVGGTDDPGSLRQDALLGLIF